MATNSTKDRLWMAVLDSDYDFDFEDQLLLPENIVRSVFYKLEVVLDMVSRFSKPDTRTVQIVVLI